MNHNFTHNKVTKGGIECRGNLIATQRKGDSGHGPRLEEVIRPHETQVKPPVMSGHLLPSLVKFEAIKAQLRPRGMAGKLRTSKA